MRKSIRLSKWAELNGYSRVGAYRAFLKGHIPDAYQLPSGTIMVYEPIDSSKTEKVVIYARVSSPKQKLDLDTQVVRLSDFCAAKGWQINHVYKEIASGLNDDRKLLNKMLSDESITRIVVEHKDRLTRFGFNYIAKLLEQRKCEVYVINHATTDNDDLMQDFISVITSMSARIYGLRRSRRKTEEIIAKIKEDNND